MKTLSPAWWWNLSRTSRERCETPCWAFGLRDGTASCDFFECCACNGRKYDGEWVVEIVLPPENDKVRIHLNQWQFAVEIGFMLGFVGANVERVVETSSFRYRYNDK